MEDKKRISWGWIVLAFLLGVAVGTMLDPTCNEPETSRPLVS